MLMGQSPAQAAPLPRDDPWRRKAATREPLSVSGESPRMGSSLPGPRAGLTRVSTSTAATREPLSVSGDSPRMGSALTGPARESLSVSGESPRMGLSGPTAVVNQVSYSTAAILTDPAREPLSVSGESPRMGLSGPTAVVNQVIQRPRPVNPAPCRVAPRGWVLP